MILNKLDLLTDIDSYFDVVIDISIYVCKVVWKLTLHHPVC